MPENVPELVSTHTMKGLLEIDETNVQGCLPFSTKIFLRMKICSGFSLPGPVQQEACSGRNFFSTPYYIVIRGILQKTLYGTESKDILGSCHKQTNHLSLVFWPRELFSSEMVLYTDQESDCRYSKAGLG